MTATPRRSKEQNGLPGKYGDSLKFNGTSSCVLVADGSDLRLGEEFTLETWVRPEGELKKDPIIFKEGSGYLNYALDIGHTTTGRAEGSIGVTTSPNHKEVASTASLQANVWTHLATTFDGAKLRLYVNGELVATKTVTGGDSGREGALKIGCDSQYGEHFHGRIDEVRVYDRALDENEVDGDLGKPIFREVSGASTIEGEDGSVHGVTVFSVGPNPDVVGGQPGLYATYSYMGPSEEAAPALSELSEDRASSRRTRAFRFNYCPQPGYENVPAGGPAKYKQLAEEINDSDVKQEQEENGKAPECKKRVVNGETLQPELQLRSSVSPRLSVAACQ